MATKTYTATVQTNKIGSECTAEFEVDEADLEGLSADERDALLHERALDAVFEMSQVYVWYEEGGEDE